MTSHPLYLLSSQPLHWYHTHFVWHQTHYMCDIICTIHNITSTLYVITLLYLWHQKLYISNYIQYIGQHIHYPCDITATNLCHHTHCIDIITPNLFKTSHSPYVWNLLPYTRHHILTLWYGITVFMTSHPLYLTLYPLQLCHHLHCIDDITPTVFMSLIFYIWWHHIRYIQHHIHYICSITDTVSVSSHPFFRCYHNLCMYDITPLFV